MVRGSEWLYSGRCSKAFKHLLGNMQFLEIWFLQGLPDLFAEECG